MPKPHITTKLQDWETYALYMENCPGRRNSENKKLIDYFTHRVQDHIFSMIYVFNIWWNILNILQVDLKEIWGIIFGPEALSSGSYQIFIQITKTEKFGKYL